MNTPKPQEAQQPSSDVLIPTNKGNEKMAATTKQKTPDGILIGHLQYDAAIQALVEENKQLKEHLSQLHAQMTGMDTATELYGSLVRRPNAPDELFFKDENGHIHSVVLHFLDKDEVQPC